MTGAFGGLHSLLAVDLAIAQPNIYLDLSSAPQAVVACALWEIPEQCLFGSNTPYCDVGSARATVEAATHDRGRGRDQAPSAATP